MSEKQEVFWIKEEHMSQSFETRRFRGIRVIEFKAYQQALDKIAELEKKLESKDTSKKGDYVIVHKFFMNQLHEKISLLEQDLESEKRSHRILKESCDAFIKDLEMANSEREKQNEELIEALEFYALMIDHKESSQWFLQMDRDRGQIARQALAKVKGEK